MLPEMYRVKQMFDGNGIRDVAEATRMALDRLCLGQRISAGARVGIPAGSRGIRNIAVILREVVAFVQRMGAVPVVVAAMGSHGGGTPEGQLEVLRSLGITPDSLGVQIDAQIDADEVFQSADGTPVFFDRNLLRCDALLIVNRVKPHTSFQGPLESGLVKMLVVGCGKPAGARQFHALGPLELAGRLIEFGTRLLEHLPVAGGIAVLENAREETAELVPVQAGAFVETEMQLLCRAKELLPRLPLDELDLLVVEQMGKNFAGTGMDTNVIGRLGIPGVTVPGPKIGRIVVLDLSEASHGNANGMGLADLVTRRLVRKVDFRATYLNVLTAVALERAKIPITLETDREALETAMQTLGRPKAPRVARIKNTLELEELWLSEAAFQHVREPGRVTVLEGPEPWRFDANGNLLQVEGLGAHSTK